MSNLQDVPLAEPEVMPTPEQEATGSKSNSLRRFFKLGKKAAPGQELTDETEELDEETNKDPNAKPGSLSRFLTRFKGNKSGDSNAVDPTEAPPISPSSLNVVAPVEEVTGKPVPNVKPTLKTSISGYWKQLFHRQKVATRQEQRAAAIQEMEQIEQMQQKNLQQEEQIAQKLQQMQESDKPMDQLKMQPLPDAAEDEAIGPQGANRESASVKGLDNVIKTNSIPDIIEEVQTLAVSDELVDPMNDDNN